MSANDYIASVKERNRKLWAASKIAMTPDSLERQLRAAFEAGRRCGGSGKAPTIDKDGRTT